MGGAPIRGVDSRGATKADMTRYAAAVGACRSRRQRPSAVGGDVVTFNALSLDEQGHPVPVMHSDDGFALFDLPPPDRLERAVAALTRPFPQALRPRSACSSQTRCSPAPRVQARPVPRRWRVPRDGRLVLAANAHGRGPGSARTDCWMSCERGSHPHAQLWSAIDAAGRAALVRLWSWSFADAYHPQPSESGYGCR